MRRLPLLMIILLLAGTDARAQLRATSVEKLPLPADRFWAAPKFSPDGGSIYYSTAGFDGIWEYRIAGGAIRQITADPRSGYGFALSADGKSIAWRRTRQAEGSLDRLQEIVVARLAGGAPEVAAGGVTLSTPVFSGDALLFTDQAQLRSVRGGSAGTAILGVENTKIVLVRGGARTLYDPVGSGFYLWPSLSPDGAALLAFEQRTGTFVADLEGNVLSRLGRRDAPVWTRDGRWVVFMDAKDDGHDFVSSDIACIRRDGTGVSRLTASTDTIELYPDCSPAGDRIVCQTAAGEILLITYREDGR